MKKGRVRLYEWVRIFATLLVVLGHSSYRRILTQWGGVDYSGSFQNVSHVYSVLFPFFANCNAFAYSFHMPLFFVLSGAVLHLKPIGPFDPFLRKKSCHLLVTYFAAGLFFMFPVKLLGNFYHADTVGDAIQSFMATTTESGHLWFLPALFWCMMIFVILLKLMERVGCQSLGVVFFASLLLQTIIPYLPFDLFGMKKGASYLVWFALGYCLDGSRGWLEKQSLRRLVLLLCITIAPFMAKRYNIWPSYVKIILGSAMVTLLAQSCISIRAVDNWERTKGYQIITRNLFNIYLFHDPLNYLILRAFVNKGWLRYGGMCILYFFARTVGVIAVSIILGELWRKVLAFVKDGKTGRTVQA